MAEVCVCVCVCEDKVFSTCQSPTGRIMDLMLIVGPPPAQKLTYRETCCLLKRVASQKTPGCSPSIRNTTDWFCHLCLATEQTRLNLGINAVLSACAAWSAILSRLPCEGCCFSHACFRSPCVLSGPSSSLYDRSWS